MSYVGNLNFASIVRRGAKNWPDREVIIDEDKRLTYKELDRRISALSGALLKMNVNRGDIIAILLFNCAAFYEIAFAANRIGAIFLPLNFRLAGEEIAYILNHSGAKALVTEADFHQTIEAVRPDVPGVMHIVTLSEPPAEDWQPYDEILESHLGTDIPDAQVELQDLHRLMYTSGTTSRPKGVMISYENLYWKNIAHIWEFDITPADRTIITGPMYHVGAFDLTASATLHRGGSVVILRKFDPIRLAAAIEEEQPTNIWLAPAMINMLLQEENVSRFDLRSIRYIVAGGERMPEPLLQRVLALFPNARFCDAYGLTESVSGDTFVPRGMVVEKLGSVGKPCLHLDLQVVDGNGSPLPPNEIGEIALCGPKVTKGYWKDEQATHNAIKNGWFYTGDMGRLDDDGYLYIIDRKKDMIISGGENISSLEVERVIYEMSEVLETAVVGIPDAKWGERVVACVVVRKDTVLTEQEVISYCQSKLAKFKVPKQVVFLPELPRNPSGKVLKRVLRDGLEGGNKQWILQ